MRPDEVIVPVVLFLSVAGILGFFFYTRHKERMSIIEKGLSGEDMKALYMRSARSPGRVNPLSSLKWGIVFAMVGVAALIGMYLHATYFVEEGIYPALMCLFGGLGLIAFYLFANKKVQS